MPYPDWIEGKQQFTRIERITTTIDLVGIGLQSVKSFSGSGEIITGEFIATKQPELIPELDYLEIFVDSIFVQRILWEDSAYLFTGSWVSPLSLGYYDGGNLGVIRVSKSISFFSLIEFKYNKTGIGTTNIQLSASLGIY